MTNEIWTSIPGYEGRYEVSSFGRVKSLLRKQKYPNGYIRAETLDSDGYSIVSLVKKGYFTTLKVHRLVAEMFIPNPENKPQVNHKNSVRKDNHVDNLEWCTVSENGLHSFRTGNRIHPMLGKRRKPESLEKLSKTVSGSKNPNAKICLDQQTGIFYLTISEAACAKVIKFENLRYDMRRKDSKKYSIVQV